MARNMDMTALRSFVAVADTGGVTKASGFLHLTQSAVSMQLKRLEESLGLTLLDRSARSIALTAAGEQLLSYARRMLELNDEALSRLTHDDFEGEITLGVPHDIVYPALPKVLKQLNTDYPRVKVHLISSFTLNLKEQFARGDCDLVLTTEDGCDPGGETLNELPLIWIGGPGGVAWKQRPLRLAFEKNCIFRQSVQSALDSASIAWEMAVDANSTRTVEASVSADLAVHAMVEGTQPAYLEKINHGGALPDLCTKKLNLYVSDLGGDEVTRSLTHLLREAFRTFG